MHQEPLSYKERVNLISSPTTTSNLTMQDFFSTTTSANITATDTVIPLNSVPTGTEGFLVLEQDNGSREIIYYTSKSSSTVTCPDVATGRGQGGTTATSHSAGVTCKQNVNAQYLKEIQNGDAVSRVPMGVAANPYKFSVYLSSASNTGNPGFALVPFNVERFDTGSNMDIATNKGRFTAPINGFYQFNAAIRTSQTSGSHRFIIGLYVNGATHSWGGDINVALAGGDTGVTISRLLQLTAGDYVEIYASGDSTLALDVSGAQTCWFDGFFVSAT